MSKSKEEFDKAISELKSCRTEDEILSSLTFIVKGFNISLYKEILLSNPYYKDLLVDVKQDVISDLKKLKEVINDEIISIDEALKKEGYSSKLRELKGDCLSLSYEIDNKIMEIKSLI
jgi:hypothetical protein